MSVHNTIIWQPKYLSQRNRNFDILIDRKFAEEMFKVKLGDEPRRIMNQLGEDVAKDFKYVQPPPYIFEGNTAFVRQINLNAGEGKWLELEGHFGAIPDFSRLEPLQYKTHNLITTSDTLALLALFDRWIFYSSTLKEISVK